MGKAAPGFLFECDPAKNTKCPKTSCFMNGGHCHQTRYGIYAKDPSKVNMIIPTDGKELMVEEVSTNDDHS